MSAVSSRSDKEAIKDGIQDLFLQLWEKRNTIGTINVISIYLIRALRNNLLYQMRKNKWQEFSTGARARRGLFLRVHHRDLAREQVAPCERHALEQLRQEQ